MSGQSVSSVGELPKAIHQPHAALRAAPACNCATLLVLKFLASTSQDRQVAESLLRLPTF